MIAFGLSIALFLFWLVLGYAVVSALHTRRNTVQSLLLAPAVGLATTVLPIFCLNRAGLSVGRFGIALGAALALLAAALLWRIRPLMPLSRYAAFLAVFLLALGLTGRPMLEFGFDWVSYANDDMANYVLLADRVLNHGFYDIPDLDAVVSGRDYSLPYWFLHVATGSRPGSELVLAWVSSMTGLTGHQEFMPIILALHVVLISAAGALVCQSRRLRLAALLTCGLLSLSALTSLGTLYQLIAQVGGLGLLATSATLLLRPYQSMPPRAAIRRGILTGIVGSGLVVVYSEVTPFIVLAFILYIAIGMVRQRSAWSPKSSVAVLGTTLLVSLLWLNRYMIDAAAYVLGQSGGASTGVGAAQSLFPYYLVPSGLASIWGFQAIGGRSGEPWLSASIALGASLLFATAGATTVLAWRRQPAGLVAVVMFALGVQLFSRRSDFGLFKLAMFVQPFMLGVLVIAWFGLVRRPTLRVVPLLALGSLGSVGQVAYVEASRGAGSGFVEVRDVSSSRAVAEFRQLMSGNLATSAVLDTANVVLAKFQATYTQGVSSNFASRYYFPLATEPHLLAGDDVMSTYWSIVLPAYERLVIADFPWFAEGETSPEYVATSRRSTKKLPDRIMVDGVVDLSKFVINTIGAPPTTSGDCDLFIRTTGRHTIFNRRQSKGDGYRNFVAQPCDDLHNHLIFAHSPIGQQYYSAEVGWIAFYQLENDLLLPGETMSGVGRRMLFQVVNPSNSPRLAVNLTATLKADGDNRSPPAIAIGTDRRALPVQGRGSARVFSPPLTPLNIADRAFVGIDLGVDGQLFPDRRTGLMWLYGTDVPFDRRRLVGFARDISLISDDEYARLSPPSSLDEFPADLTHPDLEYSGIYEDGWVSESAFFALYEADAAARLAVRGTMPLIGDPSFSSELRVRVDGREVARRSLTPGDFEVQVPAPTGGGRRRVDLEFSNMQQLPGVDRRPVAALLRFVGFEAVSGPGVSPRAVPDVVTTVSGLRLGVGWHEVETSDGESFRWVDNDADIFVTDPGRAHSGLSLDIEPGPGVASRPFTLNVPDSNGQTVGLFEVRGRQRVDVALPSGHVPVRGFRLHVDGGGQGVPDDPRTLNFRVFKLGWSDSAQFIEPTTLSKLNAPSDIGPAIYRQALTRGELPIDGLFVGNGWHPLETFDGKTFRWAENDAQIVVTAPSGTKRRVQFAVEAGPGLGPTPLALEVIDDSGRVIAMTGGVTIELPIVAGETATFSLRVDEGGLPTPNDPRILNFRVFAFDWGSS